MPIFAANLTMMFTEWSFLDRFSAAADAGFSAVEYLFPYESSATAVAEKLRQNDLRVAVFNLPPGDFAAGDRGLAALPDRWSELVASVDRGIEYAAASDVRHLHLMAGNADSRNTVAATAYRNAIGYVAGRLAERGLDLLIEPINGRSMPGYFMNDFRIAESLIADLGIPNLKLQFDVFHRQILHGDVTTALRALMPVVGHVQVSSVPSRHEPDDEEINYPFVFGELDRLGYNGFVGCEYVPRGKTRDGLEWFKPFARG